MVRVLEWLLSSPSAALVGLVLAAVLVRFSTFSASASQDRAPIAVRFSTSLGESLSDTASDSLGDIGAASQGRARPDDLP